MSTMISMSDAVAVFAITLLVAAPWLTAMVMAVKDISRNPSLFAYVVAAVVALGGTPVAVVYFIYRALRRDQEPSKQRSTV